MNSELESAALAECRAQRLAGKKPTVRSVREAIGKGSHADLGPLVKQFNEQETTMPDELSSLLMAAGERIWQQAQSSFAKTIAGMHMAASAERQDAEQELIGIREELEAAIKRGELAQEQIKVLERELTEARRLPSQLLKAHERELKALKAEKTQLLSTVEALRIQHEHDVAVIGEQQGRLKSLEELKGDRGQVGNKG